MTDDFTIESEIIEGIRHIKISSADFGSRAVAVMPDLLAVPAALRALADWIEWREKGKQFQ